MASANLKFKIGDQVKIVKDTCWHGFPIGSIIMIEDIKYWGGGLFDDSASYRAYDLDGDLMYFDDDDCVALEGEVE